MFEDLILTFDNGCLHRMFTLSMRYSHHRMCNCIRKTIFEDLILVFYFLNMIVQRFFSNAIAYSMVGIYHAEHKYSV